MKLGSLRPAAGLIAFVLLFALSLFGEGFFASAFFIILLLLLVAAAVFSVLSLSLAEDRLSARLSLPAGRAQTGTPVPFSLVFSSAFRFFSFTADLSYRVRNAFSGTEVTGRARLWIRPAIGGLRTGAEEPTSAGVFRQTLESARAGRVEAEVISCRIYDVFHLFCRKAEEIHPAALLVLPPLQKTAADEVFESVRDLPGEEDLRGAGVDSEPAAEVREYIPGDELKTVHWKLSAKKSALMVRKREKTGGKRLNLLLPLTEDTEENDALVGALCYLAAGFLGEGFPLALYWLSPAGNLMERACPELSDFDGALEEILSANGRHPAGAAEEAFLQEHPGASYIRVQTGDVCGVYISKEKE